MKPNLAVLERGRITDGPWASNPGEANGAFFFAGPNGMTLLVMSSGNLDKDWEHVSVSGKNRCPNWPEMCAVKALFWGEEETVIQFHPPRSKYVNNAEFCLHLWRPLKQLVSLPPTIMVGLVR